MNALPLTSPLAATLAVALGGGVGAAVRYMVGQAVPAPWGTMAVNVVGSFAIGLLVGWLSVHQEAQRLLLGVGLLGGFTTFSTFSLDSVRLLQAREFGMFALYAGGSVGLSLCALAAALHLMHGQA